MIVETGGGRNAQKIPLISDNESGYRCNWSIVVVWSAKGDERRRREVDKNGVRFYLWERGRAQKDGWRSWEGIEG